MPFTTTYSAIVRSLGHAFDAGHDAREGALQARLVHLVQRLNILGSANKVGRGTKFEYGPTEMEKLIFALECIEVGIGPLVAARLIAEQWEDGIGAIMRAANSSVMHDAGPGDVVLIFGGLHLASASWWKPSKKVPRVWDGQEKVAGVPSIMSCRVEDVGKHVSAWIELEQRPGAPPPHITAVNLTARMRKFHAELKVADMDEYLAEGQQQLATGPKKARA